MKRSSRLLSAPPYPFARWATRVAALNEKGVDVIRLDIGNPDLPPPDSVIAALSNSAEHPEHHGYPGYRGLPVLRDAISEYYERRFGVALDPAREVVPIIGSKEGIVNLSLALGDPGDVVLVPDPGYAPYTMGARLAGADAWTFPLLPARSFLPDLDAIPSEVAERAALMWLNYPNNPTGATASLGFLAQAVDFARRHTLLLCHDAPYCDVTYGDYVAPSILQIPGASEVAVEFNSLSKTCNMAGWRVGMAVGNAEALAALAQLKSNIDSGIFRPIQEAAAHALRLDPHWIAERNLVYRERLELVLEGLEACGLEADRPRATLYVWARVPDAHLVLPSSGDEAGAKDVMNTRLSASEVFAGAVLNATGVALAPGSFFGPGGEGYVRISVTAPTQKIREAMDRLRRHLAAA